MKRILAVGVALLVASCLSDPRFQRAPGWASYDPEVYSVEYANAVSRTILEELSGKDYETLLGERIWNLSSNIHVVSPCSKSDILVYAREGFEQCWIAMSARRAIPRCLNEDRCAAIQVDADAVRELNLRPVIERVLANPCDYAIDPAPYRDKPNRVIRNGWPPGAVYSMLWRCDSDRPVRGVVEPYDDDGIFRVRFVI